MRRNWLVFVSWNANFTHLNPSCSIDSNDSNNFQRNCFCFNSLLGSCLLCQWLEQMRDPGWFPTSVTSSVFHGLPLTLCFSVYISLCVYIPLSLCLPLTFCVCCLWLPLFYLSLFKGFLFFCSFSFKRVWEARREGEGEEQRRKVLDRRAPFLNKWFLRDQKGYETVIPACHEY